MKKETWKLGRIVAAAIVGLVGLGMAGVAHATPPAGYSLVWDDNFNGVVGTMPDRTLWSFDLGNGSNGWGNNEQETYVADAAHACIVYDTACTDGKALKITATHTGGLYESVRMHTFGKHALTYGYIEIRAKNPTGQGMWPAFWMLGTDCQTATGWPQCGEQDIMELFGENPGTNMGSFHMGTGNNHIDWTASYTLPKDASFNAAYHTFGLLWTQTGVTTYVDGIPYESHPSTSPGWVFNHPFYYLLNLAVGGNGPGNVNSSTVFPQTLYVDYIREYAAPPGKSPGRAGTTVDPLNDFSVAYNTSGNLLIDTSNPEYFDGDTARLSRWINETEWVNYKYANISNFAIQVYNYQLADASAVTVWYSQNQGGTYKQAKVSASARSGSPSAWGAITLTSAAALPAGITDLKVQIAPTNQSWDTEIGQISITHA